MSKSESLITVRWDKNETLSFLPPGKTDKGFKLEVPSFNEMLISELALDAMRRLTYLPSMQVGFVGDLLLRPVNINELHSLAYDRSITPRQVDERFRALLTLPQVKPPYKYATDPIRGYSVPKRIRLVTAILQEKGYPQEILTAVMEDDKERLDRFLERAQIIGRFRRVIRKHSGFYNNSQFKDVVATAEDYADASGNDGLKPILGGGLREELEPLEQKTFLLEDHFVTAAMYAYRGRLVGLTVRLAQDPFKISDQIRALGLIVKRRGGRILLLHEEFRGDHIAMVEEANRLIHERNRAIRRGESLSVSNKLDLDFSNLPETSMAAASPMRITP